MFECQLEALAVPLVSTEAEQIQLVKYGHLILDVLNGGLLLCFVTIHEQLEDIELHTAAHLRLIHGLVAHGARVHLIVGCREHELVYVWIVNELFNTQADRVAVYQMMVIQTVNCNSCVC